MGEHLIVLIALCLRVAVCEETLGNSDSGADVQIIHTSASVSFGDNEVLDGYEDFVKRANMINGANVYVSVHFADAQVVDQDKSDDKVVILAGHNETINVPFKNVSTYVVMRQKKSRSDLYTSHLAYVSRFSGNANVEWDLYLFHYHDTNGSFASAFFPTVDGPQASFSWKSHLRRAAQKVANKYKIRHAKDIPHAQEAHDDSITNQDQNRYLALREDEPSVSKREIEKTGDSPSVKNDEIAKRYLHQDYDDKTHSPFVGVREECPYVPFNAAESLPTAQSDLVMFYLTLLRVHCLPNYPEQLQKLFDMKLVSVKNGSTVQVERQHPLFKKRSYGESEHLDFVSALALAAFSDAVVRQINSIKAQAAENFTPDRKSISGTVKTLSSYAFSLMDDARSFQRAHAIKLMDFILVALQTHRSEMTTVMEELESCGECSRPKEISFNNQLQLVSLMRLIVDNISEILNSAETVEKIFDTYYVTHLAENILHVENKTPFVF